MIILVEYGLGIYSDRVKVRVGAIVFVMVMSVWAITISVYALAIVIWICSGLIEVWIYSIPFIGTSKNLASDKIKDFPSSEKLDLHHWKSI